MSSPARDTAAHIPSPVSGDSLSLPRKLAFLSQCGSYPERTASVEATETHMSWVFLTDRYAYKLKKPVKTDFLDFSSSSLRRHWCEEEVRLNRRLAADTYLGVMPLTVSPSGELQIGRHDEPGCDAVDWLVKMRRLPAGKMLDQVIAGNRLQTPDIKAIADRLAAFHGAAQPVRMHPAAHRRRLENEIEGCRCELTRYGSQLSPLRVQRLAETLSTFLGQQAATFDRRVKAGFLIEGHGDLRPEHVFVGPPTQIIDCIEFNRALRILDPVDDLAMLAMECDRLDAPAVGCALFAAHRAATGDQAPDALVGFYKCLRAAVRAKLAIWHFKDAVVADPAKWHGRARSYMALAEREASQLIVSV